jgi:hypothetical protein
MKTTHIIAAAALVLAGAVGAQAQTTLTFDALTETYGDGNAVGPNMFTNQTILSYTENGFVLTLNTSNPVDYFLGAHIGDGTGTPQTFNWHDGADNEPGAYVTLTKLGGGTFDLTSFDFFAYNDFSVSATGYATLNYYGTGGTVNPGFLGVSSVTFYGSGSQELDNITVNGGVPEPASWAMMLGGFGLVGGAMRRRRAAVTFA